MKEADITQVVKESERLLRENLERNKKHSKDEIDLLVSYVGNILWFTTAHQSLTLVKILIFINLPSFISL